MKKQMLIHAILTTTLTLFLSSCGESGTTTNTSSTPSSTTKSTDYSPGHAFDTSLCKPPQVNNGFGTCI